MFISVEEGWRYYGEWRKGQIYGKGVCTWLDGTFYDGEVYILYIYLYIA